MKKILTIIAIACIAFAMPSQAQVKFGLKGGLNLTTISVDNISNAISNKSGFYVGPTVKFTLPVVGLSLDASALYDQRNAKIKGTDETVKLQSFQIPVNVRYGFGIGDVARVFAFAGPQFGFVIDKEQSIKQVADWKLKTSNFSVNVGIGAMVLKHLQATVNYNIACGKTGEITLRDTGRAISKGKSNSWQLGLAYIF